jgi:hypothetical protein
MILVPVSPVGLGGTIVLQQRADSVLVWFVANAYLVLGFDGQNGLGGCAPRGAAAGLAGELRAAL